MYVQLVYTGCPARIHFPCTMSPPTCLPWPHSSIYRGSGGSSHTGPSTYVHTPGIMTLPCSASLSGLLGSHACSLSLSLSPHSITYITMQPTMPARLCMQMQGGRRGGRAKRAPPKNHVRFLATTHDTTPRRQSVMWMIGWVFRRIQEGVLLKPTGRQGTFVPVGCCCCCRNV